MEYNDQNEFMRRARLLDEVTSQHPALMKAVTTDDRKLLEQYYLGGLQADNAVEYRAGLIKANAHIETEASRAWERFMVEAGMPETLSISPQSRT